MNECKPLSGGASIRSGAFGSPGSGRTPARPVSAKPARSPLSSSARSSASAGASGPPVGVTQDTRVYKPAVVDDVASTLVPETEPAAAAFQALDLETEDEPASEPSAFEDDELDAATEADAEEEGEEELRRMELDAQEEQEEQEEQEAEAAAALAAAAEEEAAAAAEEEEAEAVAPLPFEATFHHDAPAFEADFGDFGDEDAFDAPSAAAVAAVAASPPAPAAAVAGPPASPAAYAAFDRRDGEKPEGPTGALSLDALRLAISDMVGLNGASAGAVGRGLHSSTSQLNLRGFSHKIHPEHPLLCPKTW